MIEKKFDLPGFEMIRNAEVEVEDTSKGSEKPVARVLIDNRVSHTFPATSRVSKALETADADDVAERLSGGQFFVVDGEIQTFRDGNYSGFVHSDSAIEQLAGTVGMTLGSSRNGVSVTDDNHGRFILGSKWSDSPIVIPEYHMGGEFNSELHFGWSPFVRAVNSAFMLYRLICANGMRGMRSFMSTRVPIQNRWEEHLDIASLQMQNKINGVVSNRLRQMGDERASVGELQRLCEMAEKRLDNLMEGDPAILTLTEILDMASPEVHLGGFYKESVFKDKAMADQHLGHMSVFDLYNMVTEVRSHVPESGDATTRSLDMFANDLVFERKDLTQRSAMFDTPEPELSFSDPDRAFWGEQND